MFPEASEFTRHDLFILSREELAQKAQDVGLPHLSDFIASVDAAQFIHRKNVRAYTAGIYLRGSFQLTSPISGKTVSSGSSMILRDRTVVFSFPEEPDLLVAAGDLGSGFPICAALLVSRRLFLRVGDYNWGFAERHFPMIAKVMQTSGWTPGPVTQKPQIVIGDANFAHHAWNELSCLEELIAEKTPEDLEMIAVHESLGPLKELFCELSNVNIVNITDPMLESCNSPGALLFPVGGQIITTSLIQRIINFSETKIAPRCAELRDVLAIADGPILWISVRTRNRTVTNQREMLTELGRSFMERFPKGIIVIDGFSFAANYEQAPSYTRATADEVYAEDKVEATLLAKELQKGYVDRRVFVAVGFKINDSILLAREADIYICHHGTVQHKIGWFNGVPGLVHCNRMVLASRPSAWVASKSEIAIPPLYVPIEFVRDAALDADKKIKATLPNQDNYTITDIGALKKIFLGLMDACITELTANPIN